jgi:hypothetical protein
MLLPASVLPAQPAYGALFEALGTDVNAVAKDLDLYAGDEPPAGWSLDTEIEGVLREAEVFEERHHFDPPHRIEPERLAELLREHWDRAESRHHAKIR